MIHECDYCSGWTDDQLPLDHINISMDISTDARGRRRICSRCFIDLMDWVMKEIAKERRHYGH